MERDTIKEIITNFGGKIIIVNTDKKYVHHKKKYLLKRIENELKYKGFKGSISNISLVHNISSIQNGILYYKNNKRLFKMICEILVDNDIRNKNNILREMFTVIKYVGSEDINRELTKINGKDVDVSLVDSETDTHMIKAVYNRITISPEIIEREVSIKKSGKKNDISMYERFKKLLSFLDYEKYHRYSELFNNYSYDTKTNEFTPIKYSNWINYDGDLYLSKNSLMIFIPEDMKNVSLNEFTEYFKNI